MKAILFPFCISFERKTLNLDLFLFVHWKMKASFSITIMESYTSENITAVVSEGAKVLDICTTILPDLASEGSPLLSNLCFPIIPFRFLETNVCWNQSSYGMNVPLTFIIFFAKVTTLFLK